MHFVSFLGIHIMQFVYIYPQTRLKTRLKSFTGSIIPNLPLEISWVTCNVHVHYVCNNCTFSLNWKLLLICPWSRTVFQEESAVNRCISNSYGIQLNHVMVLTEKRFCKDFTNHFQGIVLEDCSWWSFENKFAEGLMQIDTWILPQWLHFVHWGPFN